MSCRHEPPRPHQRVQGACGARRPGLQARARPAPRQARPAPPGSPIRPEHDSTRRWSPRRLPSSAPGALRCPWHRSMSGSRRSPAPPPPSPPARPARRPRSGAPQRPNLTVIVAAGGRAVLKFGAGCATTVRARGQLIGGEGGGWEQPGPEYSGACYFLGRSSTAGIGGPADPRIVEIGCRMPANQAGGVIRHSMFLCLRIDTADGTTPSGGERAGGMEMKRAVVLVLGWV